ncbi:tetraspanin-3-like [Cucumis melo var. makuwa]|uniref:Tetraspanin-3-like n=1 Tax=Cucumis melo var. makuwa TaxID=1194695 RepID=A0A5A7U9S0_CUCMM|nr:tetraspanin-3-like [Cucumis melo var. makuwa]
MWDFGGGLVGAEPDCGRWSNDQDQLCYACDSCKAGVLASLKKSWRKVSVINIIVLIILVISYVIGYAAFRNNRRIDNDEPASTAQLKAERKKERKRGKKRGRSRKEETVPPSSLAAVPPPSATLAIMKKMIEELTRTQQGPPHDPKLCETSGKKHRKRGFSDAGRCADIVCFGKEVFPTQAMPTRSSASGEAFQRCTNTASGKPLPTPFSRVLPDAVLDVGITFPDVLFNFADVF